MYTQLRGMLKFTPGRAVSYAVKLNECGCRVKNELVVCESLWEIVTLMAMIAYRENGPRWHNERRLAKVTFRPRFHHRQQQDLR